MNRGIIFRRKASRDVTDAFGWYEQQSEGLGVEFLRAIDVCVARIDKHFPSFTTVYGERCYGDSRTRYFYRTGRTYFHPRVFPC